MTTTTADTVTYITPDCPFCHLNEHFQLTAEQALDLTSGTPVQDVLPDWSAPRREQIRSGIHPSCWEEEFGSEPLS